MSNLANKCSSWFQWTFKILNSQPILTNSRLVKREDLTIIKKVNQIQYKKTKINCLMLSNMCNFNGLKTLCNLNNQVIRKLHKQTNAWRLSSRKDCFQNLILTYLDIEPNFRISNTFNPLSILNHETAFSAQTLFHTTLSINKLSLFLPLSCFRTSFLL